MMLMQHVQTSSSLLAFAFSAVWDPEGAFVPHPLGTLMWITVMQRLCISAGRALGEHVEQKV
eukprot:5898202-Karenia_brevis.AAC.1